MIQKTDGATPKDIVVSLDAFKVTRHAAGARWEVRPLTPWAGEILRGKSVGAMLADYDGQPIAQSGDGFITPERGDLDRGVYFSRRSDTLAFLSDVEAAAGRTGWPS